MRTVKPMIERLSRAPPGARSPILESNLRGCGGYYALIALLRLAFGVRSRHRRV
jgi:hypothetical protein